MTNREAIDTITGYFYQFDKTILELLQQEDADVSVCIEGIEDIDIVSANETSAIQCKYYAKTEYNHSVIKQPIILMLKHFAANRAAGIKYHLFGHYQSGHDKLTTLSCDFLKKNFLTYTKTEKDSTGKEQKITHYVHEELDLTDNDLEDFLSMLTLDINAPSIEDQYQNIIQLIVKNLDVSTMEAELYHYNSALKTIRNISMEQNRDNRWMKKSEFIRHIKERNELFDTWFIKRKGREKYIKSVRKEYLSNSLNMEPFNRFFLIDCANNENIPELKEVILLLAKKWSKTSKRQKPTFCPSIYINGLLPEKAVELKNNIFKEGTIFLDPYPFRDAEFSAQHFYTLPSVENKIQFKLIDTKSDLEKLIRHSTITTEIYQFYKNEIYFDCTEHKHAKIKIDDFSYIKDLIK